MKRFTFLLITFLAATTLFADVVQNKDGSYTADITGGSAVIDGNGCVSSLKLGGAEFLSIREDRAAGFFGSADKEVFGFYGSPKSVTAQPFGAKSLSAEGDKVTATYDEGKVVYDFTGGKLKISLTSAIDAYYYLRIMYYGGLLRTPDNRYLPSHYPVQTFTKAALFTDCDYNLLIEGTDIEWSYIVLRPNRSLLLTPRKNTPEDTETYKLRTSPSGTHTCVVSPKEYQVFQRRTRDMGVIRVEGIADRKTDEVKARLGGVWYDIPVNGADGGFGRSIPYSAGGWYTIDIVGKSGGKRVWQKTINRVGIGEVFVGAGQSNSTNSGEFQTKQESNMVSCFDGRFWQLANDPVLGTRDGTGCGSYYPAFGDALYAKYKVPIGIVSTGYGGSNAERWTPDTTNLVDKDRLYDYMMSRIRALGPYGFRALLWHQGEADYRSEAEDCYANLCKLIRAAREDAGWYFPWFAAKTTYHSPKYPRWDHIRDVYQRIWDEGIALQGPDTDTLTGDYRDMNGEGIHLSPKGLKKHGEMWAEVVSEYLDEVL